jgi:hypothetical protein
LNGLSMSKQEKDKIVAKARLWLILHGALQRYELHSRCELCKPFRDAIRNNNIFACTEDQKVYATMDMKESSNHGVCVAWAKYV